MNDPVNHPSHYTAGKIEVIDFLEDQNLDFRLANVIKYICRAGRKDPDKKEEDLRKAQWYLNRYLDKEFPDDACTRGASSGPDLTKSSYSWGKLGPNWSSSIGPDGTLESWKEETK